MLRGRIASAVIVNQVMKMMPALAATEDQPAERLVGEARKLMELYIAAGPREAFGRTAQSWRSVGAWQGLARAKSPG